MLRKEITPGMVLARSQGIRRRRHDPVAVLDVTTLWQEHMVRGNSTYKPVEERRCYSDPRNGLTHGYLAVEPNYREPLAVEERIGAMQQWLADLPAALTAAVVNRIDQTMPFGLQLAVINSRSLTGTWEEYLRASAAADKEQRGRREWGDAVRHRHALVREALEREALAQNIDVTGVSYSFPNDMVVPVGVLARLLKIEIPALPTAAGVSDG